MDTNNPAPTLSEVEDMPLNGAFIGEHRNLWGQHERSARLTRTGLDTYRVETFDRHGECATFDFVGNVEKARNGFVNYIEGGAR
jgi:hypothetical protein